MSGKKIIEGLDDVLAQTDEEVTGFPITVAILGGKLRLSMDLYTGHLLVHGSSNRGRAALVIYPEVSNVIRVGFEEQTVTLK